MKQSLRFIKYPGVKFSLINDISKDFLESGCTEFMDVFGGSGSVSLNIRSPYIVYNEIDRELVNIFRSIKMHPEEFYAELNEMTATKEEFLQYDHTKVNWKNKKVKDACLSLYRFNTSFGGNGETYKTTEKGSYIYMSKVMTDFHSLRRKIKGLIIENMDFREFITKYDHDNAFFYLDPPYPGKNWYRFGFEEGDFRDINSILKNIKGKYLMNFKSEDDLPKKIFGNPQYVKKYENRNTKEEGEFRYISYYTNTKKME
ncbi:MAG: DNA adenine methylase [Thermoplasmataceae archaeon]